MKTQRIESLRDLYLHEMHDLRDAEDQMTEVLPRMADAAKTAPLRRALEESAKHTERHRNTLDEILGRMDADTDNVVCQGMRGLVVEASKLMKRRDMDDDVLDAALIAATQKIEHYTIAGYGTLRAYAELLGDEEARDALARILEEEAEMDDRLSKVADETVNEAAKA